MIIDTTYLLPLSAVGVDTDLLKAIDDGRINLELSKLAISRMVDGGDWVHMAVFVVNAGLSLLGYGYNDMPARFFTPIIEDWSGAKFSKSVYVAKGIYEYLPPSFLNYVEFKQEYGTEGIKTLWDEAHSWIGDPKKVFRNYSSEYIAQILRKK